MAGGFRTQKSFLQTNAWQHQNLNALRYNTSQAGSVVPWMDGTTRVAVNLIDFGKYMGPGGGKKGKGVGPLPVGGTNSPGGFKGGGGGKGKGGGKKGKGQQHFSVDVAFGICQGPVTIAPQSFVWSSAGVAFFQSVGLNAHSGADGQAADSVMAGLHPPPPVGYSGTCYATGTPMDLGMSPVIPNLSFEPAGPNAGTGGNPQDANPSKVVTRFLTDPRDGSDFPLANLDPNIDTLYGDYCLALGLGISPLLTGQTQAQEWLAGLAKLTNTAIVWSGNLLKLIPYGDQPLSGNGVTWTPNLFPEYSLTDDDFLPWHETPPGQAEENQDDPILLTRSNPADAVNWLTMEYLDRSNFYNSTTLPVFDQGAIDAYGIRTGDNLNGHCFCAASAAQAAAQTHLQRLQYVRNTYKFKLGWQYCLLEPMDIVLLSGRCSDHYLDLQPVRLIAVDENENGDLTIEAEEIAVALPTCPTASSLPPGCKAIILTSGSVFAIPNDWNSANNTIEGIGGGAGGTSAFAGVGGLGGGGGGYAKIINFSASPGDLIPYQIGAGGPGGAPSLPLADQMTAGTDTWFADPSILLAGGSAAENGGTSSAIGAGSVFFRGGLGAILTRPEGGGGGGAAGPSGGFGVPTNAAGASGGSGDAGQGGAGSAGGGSGANGHELAGVGSGGGGGGASLMIGGGSFPGGAGGLYGGGGGGASDGPVAQGGGPGAQGVIVIIYCP